MKGQTSIELVATVGIALVLAAPFVIQAQDTMIDIGFGSDTAEIQASLDRLAESIRTVGSMGEPATRRVQLRLTRDMEDFQVSGDRSFIYTMERSGRQSNMTRIFDRKISASNMPVKQGIYTIEVEAWKDQVNISNLSPSGAPLTQLLTISSQKDWNQGMFNETSADRKNNSGDLGLGYTNGSTGDDLVGYWRMDAGTDPLAGSFDVKDYSGNNLNGTFQNSEGDERGKVGVFGTNSFRLDGSDDWIKVGDNQNIDDSIDENMTVSVWVKPSDVSHDQGFVTKDWGTNRPTRDWTAIYLDESGGDLVTMREGTTEVVSSTSEPSYNEWQMWTVVLDNSNTEARLYQNGVLNNTGSLSGTDWGSGDSPIRIGAYYSEDRVLNGNIGEVRIYNRTLSSSEVKDLYLKGRDGTFNGNYSTKKIDNDEETGWDSLEVNASIPSDTSVNATFKALDTNGNLVDSQDVDLGEGLKNYSLSVSNSEDAEVFINGTSSNVTKSWSINDLNVYGR